MALKGYREVVETNREYKLNEESERGLIVVADATAGYVKVPPTPLTGSELPLGLLMDDMEDLDYSDRPMKLQKNVVPLDSQVSLAMDGKYMTNMIPDQVTVAQGEIAYLADGGYISNVAHASGTIVVGRWMSTQDSDGYALLSLDID